MSDLIDRKMAMKMKFSHGINEDGRLYVPLNEVIKGLEELPSAQPGIIGCKDCKHNSLAREILAELTGMTVNDTTNQLTKRLIFGRDRDPQSKFNLGERREADEH